MENIQEKSKISKHRETKENNGSMDQNTGRARAARNSRRKLYQAFNFMQVTQKMSAMYQFILWNLVQNNEENRYSSWQHLPPDIKSGSRDNYLKVAKQGSNIPRGLAAPAEGSSTLQRLPV